MPSCKRNCTMRVKSIGTLFRYTILQLVGRTFFKVRKSLYTCVLCVHVSLLGFKTIPYNWHSYIFVTQVHEESYMLYYWPDWAEICLGWLGIN